MKTGKIISVIISIAMLIGLFAVSSSAAGAAALDGKYTVADGKLTLKLQLRNNPGINTLVADVGYNSALLTLDSVTNGEVFTEANNGGMFEINYELNPLILYFEENSVGNITADGTVAVLVFTVNEEAEDYGLTLAVENDNTFAAGEGCVPCDVIFAESTVAQVPDVLPGDINNDGKINAVDSNLIKRIITGIYIPESEEFAAADINGDNKINAVDSNLLKRILVGVDGKE